MKICKNFLLSLTLACTQSLNSNSFDSACKGVYAFLTGKHSLKLREKYLQEKSEYLQEKSKILDAEKTEKFNEKFSVFIDKSKTYEERKSALTKIQGLFHPDKNPTQKEEATKVFQQIAVSKEKILSNHPIFPYPAQALVSTAPYAVNLAFNDGTFILNLNVDLLSFLHKIQTDKTIDTNSVELENIKNINLLLSSALQYKATLFYNLQTGFKYDASIAASLQKTYQQSNQSNSLEAGISGSTQIEYNFNKKTLTPSSTIMLNLRCNQIAGLAQYSTETEYDTEEILGDEGRDTMILQANLPQVIAQNYRQNTVFVPTLHMTSENGNEFQKIAKLDVISQGLATTTQQSIVLPLEAVEQGIIILNPIEKYEGGSVKGVLSILPQDQAEKQNNPSNNSFHIKGAYYNRNNEVTFIISPNQTTEQNSPVTTIASSFSYDKNLIESDKKVWAEYSSSENTNSQKEYATQTLSIDSAYVQQ